MIRGVLTLLLILAAFATQAQTRAEKAHRPADGINAFLTACLVKNGKAEKANEVFLSKNMTLFISNSPTGKFPAGRVIGNGPPIPRAKGRPLSSGRILSCKVRIRAHWLAMADGPMVARLQAIGLRKVGPVPTIEPRSRMKVVHGQASGLYQGWGRSFLVIAAQTTQRGGRLTELEITEIVPR